MKLGKQIFNFLSCFSFNNLAYFIYWKWRNVILELFKFFNNIFGNYIIARTQDLPKFYKRRAKLDHNMIYSFAKRKFFPVRIFGSQNFFCDVIIANTNFFNDMTK